MSQPAIDLTSELLRGMRLSALTTGASKPHARSASALAPWRVKPSSISSAAGRCCCAWPAGGEQFTLESGDALFIPNGDGHALLSDPQATVVNGAAAQRNGVQHGDCINAGDQPDCPERAVIFSGCMDFELGGMQPLVKAMPEVMRVSSLLNTWRRSSRCW